MTTIKKLYVLAAALFLVLIFFLAEILKLPSKQSESVTNNSNDRLIGNLSRSLLTNQTKDFIVSWEDPEKGWQQKNISLDQITTNYLRQYTQQKELRIDFPKLEKILGELALTIKKEPVNAKLEYDQASQRIQEFSLPQNGRRLNISQTASLVASNLAQAKLTANLAIEETPPLITKNSLYQLGLNTLIAKGESDFKGSAVNRIYNIKVGLSKLQGLLVKPGEEFSFNNNLGKVDDSQGYRAEFVIKNNKVIPEYGGGLCQVSTTLFRAAINSGFPILERRPHSFPVHYYNPQGFDATIYPGSSDLRFKNDTAAYILIQNHIEGTKLVFEIFGSSDGRKVELSGPKILEQNTDGSMKTIFTRIITAPDGNVKKESFWSNYKSPAAYPLERNPLD